MWLPITNRALGVCHQDTLGQKSKIYFVNVSSDLQPYVLEKGGVELSTDHLVGSWIHWKRRKLNSLGGPKGAVGLCW